MSHVPLNRNIALTIVAACVTTGLTLGAQTTQADRLMAAARQALGDSNNGPGVATFRMKGSLKTNNPGESGAFEINCELPDKFVEFDQRTYVNPGDVVAEPSARGRSALHASTRLGFNGADVIYKRVLDNTPVADLMRPPTQAQLRSHLLEARAEFAHIILGLFAGSFAGMPLDFSSAPGANAATSVLVRGTGFTGTLTFNQQTHLPERLERVHDRDYLLAGFDSVYFGIKRQRLDEIRYADFRDVGGRKVPFRITNGRDDWNVKEFLVNVDMPAKMFASSGK